MATRKPKHLKGSGLSRLLLRAQECQPGRGFKAGDEVTMSGPERDGVGAFRAGEGDMSGEEGMGGVEHVRARLRLELRRADGAAGRHDHTASSSSAPSSCGIAVKPAAILRSVASRMA
jgi:hypothetical protein